MSILESRKVKFGKEKCAYWKSEMRKIEIGNDKLKAGVKLVIGKCGNWQWTWPFWATILNSYVSYLEHLGSTSIALDLYACMHV